MICFPSRISKVAPELWKFGLDRVTWCVKIALEFVNCPSNEIRNSIASTMPEIAEVERARTILEQILKNQTIIDVESVCASGICC
jgi:hypothetical protein